MRTNILKSYIKTDGVPHGLVVAVNDNGVVRFGYSLVNANAEPFTKEKATRIAINRAAEHVDLPHLPDLVDRKQIVSEHYFDMFKRATKYFQDCDIIPIGLGEFIDPPNFTE